MKHAFGDEIDAELDALRISHGTLLVSNLTKNRMVAWPVLEKIVRLNPPRVFLDGPQDWQTFLLAVFDAARLFSPQRVAEARGAVQRAAEISEEIQHLAHKLAKALRARSEICNHYDLTRPRDFHPVDLLAKIQPEFHDLGRKLDIRSWPSTADMIEALANLQTGDHPPNDDTLAQATNNREVSIRNFWRALDRDLAHIAARGVNVALSAQDFVDLTNALLDHPKGCTLENFNKLKQTQHTPDNSQEYF